MTQARLAQLLVDGGMYARTLQDCALYSSNSNVDIATRAK